MLQMILIMFGVGTVLVGSIVLIFEWRAMALDEALIRKSPNGREVRPDRGRRAKLDLCARGRQSAQAERFHTFPFQISHR